MVGHLHPRRRCRSRGRQRWRGASDRVLHDAYRLAQRNSACRSVALTATERTRKGRTEQGFSLRVGGGLSADPHLGVRLNVFIPLEKAIDVVRGVAELFREQSALRENRERARLKHLFLQQGWTEERFRCELEWRLGYKLDPAEYEQVPADIYRDHVGIHPQRQPGLAYVGASVLRGRVCGDQLAQAAE